jgi:hypothetical protein
MILYEDNQRDVEGLDEVELQHLGHQLVDFVTTYRKSIYITDQKVEQRLEILYDVGNKIIQRQYHLLFNDPNVVIPNISNQTLSDYQRMLAEANGFL